MGKVRPYDFMVFVVGANLVFAPTLREAYGRTLCSPLAPPNIRPSMSISEAQLHRSAINPESNKSLPMNKPGLIEHMMALANHNREDITQAVNVILSAIEDSLASGGRVEVRGFGAFDLRYHPPRVGRNPKTGESINVTGAYRPYFKPGKELREGERGNIKWDRLAVHHEPQVARRYLGDAGRMLVSALREPHR